MGALYTLVCPGAALLLADPVLDWLVYRRRMAREPALRGGELMTASLVRITGAAAPLGGALIALSVILQAALSDLWTARFSLVALKPTFAPVAGLELAGAVLVLLGLVGLYQRQADRIGPLGLAGFLLAFAGTALLVGFTFLLTFVVPELARIAPRVLDTRPSGAMLFGFNLMGWLLAAGYAAFGAVTLRTGILPRGGAVLVMASALINLFPRNVEFWGVLILGLGIAWLGSGLWRS